MSTYLYLVCRDHDPVLVADEESGQHLYDLDQIRQDIANPDELIRDYLTSFTGLHFFRRNTASFLANHPKCRIGIRDEYGMEHSTKLDKS